MLKLEAGSRMGEMVMTRSFGLYRWLMAGVLVSVFSAASAADLDPKAVVYKLPDQIKWNENPAAGNANAVLYGDPSKTGLYIVLAKWYPRHEPTTFPSQRPVHHGHLGNLVGG